MAHASVDDDEVADTAAQLTDGLAIGPTVAIGLTKWRLNTGHTKELSRPPRRRGTRDGAQLTQP